MIRQLEPPSNPFATRFVRPGALPFRFPGGQSRETIRRRLEQAQWCGQIVGKHGSGKTTLLRTLDDQWAGWGRIAVTVTLRDQQRRLPIALVEANSWTTKTQVIVDGYEQLCWTSRCWLSWRRRRTGCGLLVTTHGDMRLPTIFRTHTTQDLACNLVRELTWDRRDASLGKYPSQPEILRAFERSDGNMRETLFLLFDLCS